jgi:hypothetical protein
MNHRNHRERYAMACEKAFEGFEPDFSKLRGNPKDAQTIYQMAKQGYYSKEIADAVGKTPKAIQKFFRRYNFPVLHNIEPPRLEERHDWKGGTKMMKGYLYRRVLDHPNGTTHGNYVAEHRLVMEQKLGRYLLPTEVVDHIDGDITNNHPDNLRVFSSNAEHLSVTLKGRCPNWSDEGLAAIDHARRQPRRTWKGQPIQPNREM